MILIMKKLIFTIPGIFLVMLSMALTGCDGDKQKDDSNPDTTTEVSDSISEQSPVAERPVKLEAITEKTQPEESVIVFDASVSMKGYVDATVNGSFPGVISELNNAGKSSKAYLFDTAKTPIDNFVSKIQHKKIEWTKESDLFGMVEDILNSAVADPQNCYALVTDGIMSGSNAEIALDSTYNISKPEILKGKIDSIINHLPDDRNISLLVAAYTAPFKGTYYCYNNSKKELNNQQRPFYVLIAGGTAQINYMADYLQNRDGRNLIQYGTIYPMSLSTNAKVMGNHKFKFDKSVKDAGLNMTISIDSLPAYAKNVNYLTNNLEIQKISPKGKVTILKPDRDDTAGDYSITVEGNKAKISYSEKTINTLPASFRFSLKRVQPQWVEDMNTFDDIKAYNPNATLNLHYFMQPFLRMNHAEYLNDPSKAEIEIVK